MDRSICHTLNTRTGKSTYYEDSKRVSKQQYMHLVAIAVWQDSFVTKVSREHVRQYSRVKLI